MFKSYTDLEQYLKDHTDLCMVRRYLADQVKEEANFLVKSMGKLPKEERLAAVAKCTKEAQEDYLEDINYYLTSDSPDLTSMSVMGYRRKIHAWAIADQITYYKQTLEA